MTGSANGRRGLWADPLAAPTDGPDSIVGTEAADTINGLEGDDTIFGQGGAEASAAKLRVPFLGRLPLSTSLREASDAGRPPAAGDGPAAEAFAAIARKLLAELEKVSS